MQRISNILKWVELKFPSQKMEEEYALIRRMNVNNDFRAAAGMIILIHFIMIIYLIPRKELLSIYMSVGQIVLAIILIIVHRFIKSNVHYLVLALLFSYSISRMTLISIRYPQIEKESMLFNGYSIATVNLIMISQIHMLPHKIVGIIILFGLRFGIIMSLVTNLPELPITLVRHFIIDSFLIYIYFSKEKINRKVFQNYYNSREELVKFKELLDESLPQSVTILDKKSHRSLFSNHAFLQAFDSDANQKVAVSSSCNRYSEISEEQHLDFKPALSSLVIDKMTIREIGKVEDNSNSVALSDVPDTLEEAIWKLIDGNTLGNKTMSLAASYLYNGHTISLEVILKMVKWDSAEAVAVILNDITYQKNIIALKAANTNKDKIIATISHELRTPLHVMLGLLESAEKKINDTEVLKELSLCRDNAQLLWSLVSSILDFHQIGTGKLNLNPTYINIRNVMKEVVRLFEFQCSEKKINLELEVSQNVPVSIVTDGNRLKQILVNLVSNAIKFTFTGGIKICVEQSNQESDSVQIAVIDTGIGIKEEDKARLFKMYANLEDGKSVNKNGVGLGLTISNLLAKLLSGNAHGGGIKLMSEKGVGSTFYFGISKDLSEGYLGVMNSISDPRPDITTENAIRIEDNIGFHRNSQLNEIEESKLREHNSLAKDWDEDFGTPLSVESKLIKYIPFEGKSKPYKKFLPKSSKVLMRKFTQRNEDLEVSSPQGNQADFPDMDGSRCILVVDDSPFNLLIAKNLLKDVGSSVITAMSGVEAIEIVRSLTESKRSIKAILMDCQMPVMDGYETTRILTRMMERNEIEKIPILAWTANNSREDIERCYECGMVGHLTKPTSQDDLSEALKKINSVSE